MIPRAHFSNQQAAQSEANTVMNQLLFHPNSEMNNLTDYRPPPPPPPPPVLLPGQVPSIEAHPTLSSHPIQFNLINPLEASVLSPPPLAGFTTTSLKSIPSSSSKSPKNIISFASRPEQDLSPHQKRSSIEMEDDLTTKEAPPTKQLLSESKLFKQFGSLQINNENLITNNHPDGDEIEVEENERDCELEDITASTSDVVPIDDDDEEDIKCKNVRREFENYVYLLFKGKDSSRSNTLPEQPGFNAILDRMIRDEKEKLSKAVILWSPPLKDSFQTVDDSDDEEEFNYKDHRDFLKHTATDQSSIVITEIDEIDYNTESIPTMEATLLEESDDVMAIE